jgi:hypothetical protein
VGSSKLAGAVHLALVIDFGSRGAYSEDCAISNAKKKFLLQLSRLVEVQLVASLDLLGIESPEKKSSNPSTLGHFPSSRPSRN